ncbi:MAG TPA: glycosyltransferase family 2 protein [Planctomycetota bacterium]|nr:glycosyltransferase family 2 protein [Planctomycetota bacterium]
MSRISVVIPVFNEADNLEMLHERLQALGASGEDDYELIFVDDGSSDGSLDIIRRLSRERSNVGYLSFSRNFGHEAATTAGLDHATGEATVIIDADLQDPPEVIPQLVGKWREGYEVVYATRRTRKGEKTGKRLTAWLFYRLINRLSDVPIPVNTGDFRLMDRRVVESFRGCREQSRFVRGLIAWTGFRQASVAYEREPRLSGETKYGLFKLVHLAFDAVTGFSTIPLRVGVLVGMLVCGLAMVVALWVAANKLFWGIPIPGYAMLATGLFFLGGVQLFVTGLVGSYVGRIYREVKKRPLYIVADRSESLQSPGKENGSTG